MARKTKLFLSLLSFIFIVWACFLYFRDRGKGPNIVLITLDALRPDHLGCYGYSRNTSPNIDRLAKEGIIFSEAIAQTTWTGSLASLMTSTYPSTHKVGGFGEVLDPSFITLAEALKENGYLAACASGGDCIHKDLPGIAKGFDHFFNALEIDNIARETLGWLEKNRDKKFFIWLHFFAYPHAPYLPPAPYNEMFVSKERGRELAVCAGLKTDAERTGCIPGHLAVDNINNIDYYIAQYDGEIAYADEQIGKIMEGLKRLGLYKDTVVIISADHGESLGEHGYFFQHGFYLYDPLLRIPLIMKGPGIPKGRIIGRQVQEIDIMPTVFSLARVRSNAEMEGRSLLPVIFNREDKNNDNYAFGEISDDCNLISVRSDGWKLIRNLSLDKYELYDLKTDPGETHNLIGKENKRFGLLKARLQEYVDRVKPEITPSSKELSEEEKVRLKGLGYMQ